MRPLLALSILTLLTITASTAPLPQTPILPEDDYAPPENPTLPGQSAEPHTISSNQHEPDSDCTYYQSVTGQCTTGSSPEAHYFIGEKRMRRRVVHAKSLDVEADKGENLKVLETIVWDIAE